MEIQDVIYQNQKELEKILQSVVTTDCKIFSILAILSGWPKEEVKEALQQIASGGGWAEMIRISNELEEPFQRFRKEITGILAEREKDRKEARDLLEQYMVQE